jgi:hypothetical protein
VVEGIQVFAGQRSEPFFLDVRMIERTVATGKVSFKPKGSDTLYGTNILAIVMKIEWRKMLKGGPLFAVVCETLTIYRPKSMASKVTVRRRKQQP